MKNKLLSNEELELYSYVSLKNKMLEIFKVLKYSKRKYRNESMPRVTSNYNIKYEQRIDVHNSAVEYCALNNLMKEIEIDKKRLELLSKIAVAMKELNELEIQVFDFEDYIIKSEDELIESLCYGIDKIREIRKSACIKFLTSLRLDTECFKN